MAARESARAWARRRRASWSQAQGSSIFAGCRSTIYFQRSTKSERSQSSKALLKTVLQRGHDRLPIRDQPDIRALEDQRVRVIVDRDYRLRALETARMVGSAAHSDRNVEP